jgi:hypothetical protein
MKHFMGKEIKNFIVKQSVHKAFKESLFEHDFGQNN